MLRHRRLFREHAGQHRSTSTVVLALSIAVAPASGRQPLFVQSRSQVAKSGSVSLWKDWSRVGG